MPNSNLSVRMWIVDSIKEKMERNIEPKRGIQAYRKFKRIHQTIYQCKHSNNTIFLPPAAAILDFDFA